MSQKCECYATLSKNDPRYPIWKQIDPQARIPLKHPILQRSPKDSVLRGALFYEGDPERLTPAQKEKLAEILSEKFKVPKTEVLKDLAKGYLPLKSQNVSVSICNLHLRCMM